MHVSTFIRITTFLSVWSPVSGAERTSGAKGEGSGQSVCIYTIIETLARTWRVIKRSRVDSAHDRYLWSWSPVMPAITGSLEHQIRSSSKVGPSLTTPWHYHDGRDTCLQIFISPWIRDESLKSLTEDEGKSQPRVSEICPKKAPIYLLWRKWNNLCSQCNLQSIMQWK